MGFLGGVAVEVIAAVLAAGVLEALGWLGARLFRQRRADSVTDEASPAPQPRPLRVRMG